MGSGHGHGHRPAGIAGARHRRALLWALLLTTAFVGVEVAAGLLSGSLALLSDAGHMLTDSVGMGLSLAAVTAAAQTRHAPQRTFGLYRLEILAALANTVLLVAVAGYVLVQAALRVGAPVEVQPVPMAVVAVAGLAVNLAAWALLRRGARESLAVRGAYLEVVADAAGSAGVLLGGLLILGTGWHWVDSAVAVGIGVLILPRALGLGRQALRILVESAPRHVDVAELRTALEELPGVVGSHDLHVWTLTSGMDAASVHLQVPLGADSHDVLDRARRVLQDRFGIAHATVQTEPIDHEGCREVSW